MEKPDIIKRDEGIDYDIWHNTYDPDFIDINLKSFVPYKWLSYPPVSHGKYANSIIKPINRYVENLCPPPSLVGIDGNTITLRQGNHAEFYLLHGDGEFYNVDRPHLRQYYQTNQSFPTDTDCFENFYKFYVPWFVDDLVHVTFKQVNESPFKIYEVSGYFNKVDKLQEFINPIMVPFAFKKVGSHMVQESYGRIKRNSPMFDMVFEANDIIIEKIRDFYEKHN